jgi:hypothetical protein
MLAYIAQFAQCFTAIVAGGALWFAWQQVKLNRTNQRETTAKATFREFLKIAVEHPKLADGNYRSIIDDGLKSKYEWFVGYFLWAAEEVLAYVEQDAKGDPTWTFNLQMVANRHREYFQSPEFQAELSGYNKSIRFLVERAIQRSA